MPNNRPSKDAESLGNGNWKEKLFAPDHKQQADPKPAPRAESGPRCICGSERNEIGYCRVCDKIYDSAIPSGTEGSTEPSALSAEAEAKPAPRSNLEPTYFVQHPDGSHSKAAPQPTIYAASAPVTSPQPDYNCECEPGKSANDYGYVCPVHATPSPATPETSALSAEPDGVSQALNKINNYARTHREHIDECWIGKVLEEAQQAHSALRQRLQYTERERDEANRQLKELKRGLRNNNTDFELAFLDAYLDQFKTLTRSLTAAQAELRTMREALRGMVTEFAHDIHGQEVYRRAEKALEDGAAELPGGESGEKSTAAYAESLMQRLHDTERELAHQKANYAELKREATERLTAAQAKLADTERERDALKQELEDEYKADAEIQEQCFNYVTDLAAAQAELRTTKQQVEIVLAERNKTMLAEANYHSKLDHAQAELRTMREALEPFARLLAEGNLSGGEAHVACSILWEDLERAEAALRTQGGESGEK